MQMWSMFNRTTEEQARKNRDRRNGKSAGVEATATTYDANDVSVSMESSRMVYDIGRSDKAAGSTGECSHGGHDRCICGMDESRG